MIGKLSYRGYECGCVGRGYDLPEKCPLHNTVRTSAELKDYEGVTNDAPAPKTAEWR